MSPEVEQYHDDTREYFERNLAPDAPPLEKIRELITVETAHTAENLTKSSLFSTEWRSLSPQRQQVIIAERARHEHAVDGWIREARTAGEVRRDVDPELATPGIFGMVDSVYRWYRSDGRMTAEQVGEQFRKLVVDGLVEP